mgnify:FL=1
MKKLIIIFVFIQYCFGESPKYGDEQIVIILKEYFNSIKQSPTLLGHRFYNHKYEYVFQLEIETSDIDFNDGLIFGFNAISKIADVAKSPFTHSILIIHFEGKHVPIVAKSEIECSKSFFMEGVMDETQWRKKCLTITAL